MFPEVIRRLSHTTTEQVLLGKENGLGGAGRAGGEIKPAGVLVFQLYLERSGRASLDDTLQGLQPFKGLLSYGDETFDRR